MSLGWIPPTPLQFNKIKTTLPTDKAILSHTSFITPLSKSVAVVADISRVNRQLDQLLADGDSGLLAISLLAKPFDGCYETISVWRDSKSLVNFYAKGTHGKVMKNWKKFLTQEPFERSDVVRYSISFGDIPQTQRYILYPVF